MLEEYSDDENIGDDETPVECKTILESAENGHLAALMDQIERNSMLVDCVDCDGYSPLHRASYNGHLEVVKYLVKSGANIRRRTNDGWLPVHSAAKWGHTSVVAYYLDHGVDVNSTTKSGVTLLHLAAEHAKTNRALIELILFQPDVDLTLKTENGDTAYDVARRTGPLYQLFHNLDPMLERSDLQMEAI